MKWKLMKGAENDFSLAPQWAKRLINSDGRILWWDGMRKFKPINGNEFILSDRFEDEYRLIAERRLVPKV
ncbi:hypothetical protein [Yersinia bercovieri]|uniref:hypothetical protein n=1 Tax=Yersinia bercovieri TaxID=634 RepID=UPI0011A31423|nr:hypothetical protein [Yersinia bercovieri]